MQNLERTAGYLSKPLPKEFIENTDIPIFAPREKSDVDKYDKDQAKADDYTGIFSFGYRLLNSGGTESLYRTLDSIILSTLSREKDHLFLDVGCGIGRTLYDLADLFPTSLFIGLDYSYNMLTRACRILLEGKDISIDLTHKGFGKLTLPGRQPKDNVILIQGNALDIPFHPGIFDCVTNTFLIDRVPDAQKCIAESVKMLKPGGLFVFSDPLNFDKISKTGRQQFGNVKTLIDFIRQRGIRIEEWFDGLIYRELEDSRGNCTDWKALVVYGRKK